MARNLRTNPLKVKRWLERGELTEEATDTRLILEEAGGLLDDSCAGEIVGQGVYFIGEDGKVYGVSTEVVIFPASKEAAEEALKEADLQS